DLAGRVRAFQGLTLVAGRTVAVAGTGEATQAPAAVVSPTFLDVLGVKPVLGQGFRAGHEQIGGLDGRAAVMLTYSNWQARFGGSTAVLGQ
ncbi:MAG: hypothetical protein JNL98_43990, partial [Bryobacterales bacterium]|nr:hypothetical protein [Bryobacterales bacterium]